MQRQRETWGASSQLERDGKKIGVLQVLNLANGKPLGRKEGKHRPGVAGVPAHVSGPRPGLFLLTARRWRWPAAGAMKMKG
jgi:hypothetical protein